MPVPQRVNFLVVFCNHLEQARCLFHRESIFLWDGPESPSRKGLLKMRSDVDMINNIILTLIYYYDYQNITESVGQIN
jgi:hypothetical protein